MKLTAKKYAVAMVESLESNKDVSSVSAKVKNLVAILRKRKQGKIMKRFYGVFKEEWQSRRGEVEVKVILPSKPTNEDMQELKSSLDEAFGGKAILSVSVDDKLIGGMKLEFGEYVVDGSIARNLSRLEAKLNS